jgi:hypothetical protein
MMPVYRTHMPMPRDWQSPERSTTLHHFDPHADRLDVSSGEAWEDEAWMTEQSLSGLSTSLLDQEEYTRQETEDVVSTEGEGSNMDKTEQRRKKSSEASARFRARKRQKAQETEHDLEKTRHENDLLRQENLLLRNQVETLKGLLTPHAGPRCARHASVVSAESSHVFPSGGHGQGQCTT